MLMISRESDFMRVSEMAAPKPSAGLANVADAFAIRCLDVVIALAALIVLLPVLVIISIAIFVSDPGPIIFAHRRIGRGGKEFPCFKFRSMVVDADRRLQELLERDESARAEWAQDHKLRDDPRITVIGGFLRRNSFDELPQLINVLRGEMSIVGPRPIVVAEIKRYKRFFANYASVKPGITGLWQVSGRNNTTYRRRVALDVAYSRSRSFLFNLRIVFMTIPAVVAQKGSF